MNTNNNKIEKRKLKGDPSAAWGLRREQIAKLIIETNKSVTSLTVETGIDVNTVCGWVRDYRRKHNCHLMQSRKESSKSIRSRTGSQSKESFT